jgi:hypothetical protein
VKKWKKGVDALKELVELTGVEDMVHCGHDVATLGTRRDKPTRFCRE